MTKRKQHKAEFKARVALEALKGEQTVPGPTLSGLCGLRPRSARSVERLHRTRHEEHFRMMRRKNFYDGADEMQKDLDEYLTQHNTKRPHSARGANGRTRLRAFTDGLPKPTNKKEGKMTPAA